jgi:hypothetical protein
MVMRLGDAVELTPNSRLVLHAIAWRANPYGVLRVSERFLIPFSYCGRDVDVKGSSLARALNELVKKKLIYKFKRISGGINVKEVERLFAIARSKWSAEEEAEFLEEIGTSQNERSHLSKWEVTSQNERTHLSKWEDNNNYTTHTHVCDSMSMDGEGCSEVKESQQEEGAQGVQGELVATTLFRQFMKCYPKRDFLDRQKCLMAWHMALQRGWLEEDIIEALKNAAAKWKQEKRKRCPNGDEFIRDEHMRTFLPDELLAKRFPGDASFYSAVAAKAIEQSSPDRLGVKRVSAASRYEAVVGYTMNMPTEIA